MTIEMTNETGRLLRTALEAGVFSECDKRGPVNHNRDSQGLFYSKRTGILIYFLFFSTSISFIARTFSGRPNRVMNPVASE